MSTPMRALPILLPILAAVLAALLAASLLVAGVGLLPTLGLVLPALLAAWLLAVWLPGRSLGWPRELLLAVLLSFMVFLLSGMFVFVLGGSAIHGVPTDLSDLRSYLDYSIFALMFSLPLLFASDVLLYLGGRAVRLHRSLARVILGSASAGSGFVLWAVSVGVHVFSTAYMMET